MKDCSISIYVKEIITVPYMQTGSSKVYYNLFISEFTQVIFLHIQVVEIVSQQKSLGYFAIDSLLYMQSFMDCVSICFGSKSYDIMRCSSVGYNPPSVRYNPPPVGYNSPSVRYNPPPVGYNSPSVG